MDKAVGTIRAYIERVKNLQPDEKKSTGAKSQRDCRQSDALEKRGVYKRYRDITFTEIQRRGLPEGYAGPYRQVKAYADAMPQNIEQGKGLVLKGGYGTLKTTFAVAVLRQHLDAGGIGLFVPMAALIDNLFSMRERNKEEWVRYEAAIRGTTLLVLDDLGAENTDQRWVLCKVDSIITERYNRMLPTIVTTNLSAQDLLGTYSGRIYDRLRSTSEIITFEGKSQRVQTA